MRQQVARRAVPSGRPRRAPAGSWADAREASAEAAVAACLECDWEAARASVVWDAADARAIQAVLDPRLLDLPSRLAAEAQLRLLTLAGGGDSAGLWLRNPDRRLFRAVSFGGSAKRERPIANRAAKAEDVVEAPGAIGLPLLLWGTCQGVLVVLGESTLAADRIPLLRATARALAAIVQRETLLYRSLERERLLTQASERRLLRTGFDLHDGPVQSLASVSLELGLVRKQIRKLVGDGRCADLAEGRIDDVRARLDAAAEEVRGIVHSLETGSIDRATLPDSLRTCADLATERLGLEVDLRLSGTFDGLTDSQRLAITRIVQESLSNVAEHSGTRGVRVTVANAAGTTTVEVVDDGKGFEVGRALVRAAQNGRLGIVGMSERARLLGGKLDVASGVGGPTTVRLILPEWRPLHGEEPAILPAPRAFEIERPSNAAGR